MWPDSVDLPHVQLTMERRRESQDLIQQSLDGGYHAASRKSPRGAPEASSGGAFDAYRRRPPPPPGVTDPMPQETSPRWHVRLPPPETSVGVELAEAELLQAKRIMQELETEIARMLQATPADKAPPKPTYPHLTELVVADTASGFMDGIFSNPMSTIRSRSTTAGSRMGRPREKQTLIKGVGVLGPYYKARRPGSAKPGWKM